jgi:hypothetical protein
MARAISSTGAYSSCRRLICQRLPVAALRVHGQGCVIDKRVDGGLQTPANRYRQLFFDQRAVQAAGLVRNAPAAKHIQARWAGEQAVDDRKDRKIGV